MQRDVLEITDGSRSCLVKEVGNEAAGFHQPTVDRNSDEVGGHNRERAVQDASCDSQFGSQDVCPAGTKVEKQDSLRMVTFLRGRGKHNVSSGERD